MGLERPTTLSLARDLTRTRGFRWAFGAGLVILIGIAGATAVVVTQARSSECAVRSHPPLSMAELIDVRKRFDAYRRDPSEGLQLSGEELSMLLEDRADVPVFVDIQGQHVDAQVVLPSSEGRCWPVDFKGQLTVDDGIAYLVPEQLTVGHVDLSPFARGVRMELMPEHMPSAKAASFLRQTRSVRVDDGQMQVELHDPPTFSWKGNR